MYFFMGTAIDFSLISFYRLFSLQTTSMNVLQLRQKNFPTYPKYIFRCIFSAESIGTLSFTARARFLGVKRNFSVLNAKNLKKFSRFKPVEVPIKNFSKNLWALPQEIFSRLLGEIHAYLRSNNSRIHYLSVTAHNSQMKVL